MMPSRAKAIYDATIASDGEFNRTTAGGHMTMGEIEAVGARFHCRDLAAMPKECRWADVFYTYLDPVFVPEEAKARVEQITKLLVPANVATRPPTLYHRLQRAGVDMASHESDLYVRVCNTSTAVLLEFVDQFRQATRFRDQRNNEICYDIPFAYFPFWEAMTAKTA